MAFAYFTVHIKHGLLPIVNSGEPAALYSWIFVLIAVMGPGPWALASKLSRAQRSNSYRTDAGEAAA
jgi:putative oxidoreductase